MAVSLNFIRKHMNYIEDREKYEALDNQEIKKFTFDEALEDYIHFIDGELSALINDGRDFLAEFLEQNVFDMCPPDYLEDFAAERSVRL